MHDALSVEAQHSCSIHKQHEITRSGRPANQVRFWHNPVIRAAVQEIRLAPNSRRIVCDMKWCLLWPNT
jgi:hypothetical protein